jgi:hypothetical protein
MERGCGEEERSCGGGVPCRAKTGAIAVMLEDGVQIKIMPFFFLEVRKKDTKSLEQRGAVHVLVSYVIIVIITIALEEAEEPYDPLEVGDVILEAVMLHRVSEHAGFEEVIVEVGEDIEVNLSYHGVIGFHDPDEHPEPQVQQVFGMIDVILVSHGRPIGDEFLHKRVNPIILFPKIGSVDHVYAQKVMENL